jgi:lipopolysaccharide/colanic/teichoic acid biosynthesis glycosyltransferase
MCKRFFDILVSIIIIFLLFPVLLILIVMIKFQLPGPIFFIQQRIGLEGYYFKLIKFRSMKLAVGKSAGSFDLGDSSRTTPFGRLMRRAKLDELPQLINVFKGDMSIVGPRPEVKQWAEVYPEKWKIVHSVKPGITDNASIEFRNEEELLAQSEDPIKTYKDEILPRKLDLYIDYVNNQSFWGDIMIILKTIKVVILK